MTSWLKSFLIAVLAFFVTAILIYLFLCIPEPYRVILAVCLGIALITVMIKLFFFGGEK